MDKQPLRLRCAMSWRLRPSHQQPRGVPARTPSVEDDAQSRLRSAVGRKILIRAIMRLDRSGVSEIAYLTTSINPMIVTTFSPRLSASGQSIDSKPRMPPIENSRVPVHLRHARPVTID